MGKSKLTKADLVELLLSDEEVAEFGLSRKEVAAIVGSFIVKLRQSIENLDDEDRIELRGFGTFGVKVRKARTARNPRTGESVEVPKRRAPYFKAGRDLKKSILESPVSENE